MNGRRIYWFGLCLWSSFGFVLQINAQESGDGFTGSDRNVLHDVRTQVIYVKNDTQSIKESVDSVIIPTLVSLFDGLNDVQSDVSSIRSAQSSFNSTQQNMLNTLLNWESNGLPGTEDLPLIQLNTYNSATHLSYIRPDVNDILDNTTQMNGHLLNIDRETAESSDYLASIDQQLRYLISVSTNNAGVGDDLVVALTNSLSALLVEKPVDLSMVTNSAVWNEFLLGWAVQYPDFVFYPEFGDFLETFFDDGSLRSALLRRLISFNPQIGLPMAILASALRSDPGADYDQHNLFDVAYDAWFGEYSYDYFDMILDSDYSIFDAYNTLGLRVLTNQMNTVSNVLGEVRDLLASNVAQVVKVNTSIGYDDSQDEDLNLEHGDDSRLPEWEERYQAHLSNWTNSYYYESIFQGSYSRMAEASNVVNDFFTRLDQSPGDFHHTLTWSGLSFGNADLIGGWDLDVTISKDDPNYADVRSLTNGVFSVCMAFLNLCIVAYFMRRIYGKLMKSPLL